MSKSPNAEPRHPGSYPAYPIGPDDHGLTKREYIAAAALQAILTHSKSDVREAVSASVKYADALLLELERS